MSAVVTSDSKLLGHLTVLLKDGSVADSTKVSGRPSLLQMGDESLADALETVLLEKSAGDTVTVELPGHQVFGKPSPDNIHFFEISQFPADIELVHGNIVEFQQMNGSSLPGVIREVQGASVKVDFNHPLSDADIVVEVQILAVDAEIDDYQQEAAHANTAG